MAKLTNFTDMSKLATSLAFNKPVTLPKFSSLTAEEIIEVDDYVQTFPQPLQTLVDIHTYCRPHNSQTVDDFVEKFLLQQYPDAYLLRSGDMLATSAVVICTDQNSRTMFSAHVDTVHSYSGRQVVEYDTDMNILFKPSTKREQFGDCLGADDGAGIWLLLQMIDAGVPGTYMFHYGEERGGIGSSDIATHHQEFLAKFDRAIAFDRKGTTDVITHQGMGRCCSDKFARELAAALNATGSKLSMAPDNGGIFTDTANYTEIIPECTNISCGYESAHTSAEFLDVEYLFKLRDALVQIDWEALPTCRDPKEADAIEWGYESYSFTRTTSKKAAASAVNPWDATYLVDDLRGMRYGQMVEWVKKADDDTIAEVLYEMIDQMCALEEENADLNEALSGSYNNDVPPHAYRDYMDDEDDFDSRLDVGLR